MSSVPLREGSVNFNLFDLYLPDLPSVAPMNALYLCCRVAAAVKSLNCNKAPDLHVCAQRVLLMQLLVVSAIE